MLKSWNKQTASAYFLKSFVVYNIVGSLLILLLAYVAEGSALVYLQNFAIQALILVSAFIFARSKKIHLLEDARLNRSMSVAQIICLVGITFACIFANLRLSNIFIAALYKAGMVVTDVAIDLSSFGGIVAAILIVCLMPAIGEEFFIRQGVLSGFCRDMKGASAIAMSALFFSLMHTNPAQTVHQFFFGCFLAAVVIITRSLWASMIMHFANNLYVIIVCIADPSQQATDYGAIATDGWSVFFAVLMFVIGTVAAIALTIMYAGVTASKQYDEGDLPVGFEYTPQKGVKGLFVGGIAYLKHLMNSKVELTPSTDGDMICDEQAADDARSEVLPEKSGIERMMLPFTVIVMVVIWIVVLITSFIQV